MAVEVGGTSKVLLGGFTILMLLTSIVSLVYGIFLLLANISVPYNYGPFNLFTLSILVIVVGSLLIIATLFGLFGALKDVSTLRMLTLLLVFLSFFALAVFGIWTMVSYQTGHLKRNVDSELNKLNTDYLQGGNVSANAIQYLSKKYNCCFPNIPVESDLRIKSTIDSPICNENDENNCPNVYYRIKSASIFQFAVLSLAAAGAILLGLLLYGLVSKRARAGYHVVSRG